MLLLLPLLHLGACTTGSPAEDSTPATEAESGFALTVRVTDESGAPVGGAWVSLGPVGRDDQTDADGNAVFRALEAGSYTVDASATRHRPSLDNPVELTADASLAVGIESVPRDTGRLFGRVIDSGAAGNPVAGATVRAGDATTTTDGDGLWLLDLAPGSYDLEVEGENGGHWESAGLSVTEDVGTMVYTVLPGQPPADADFVGTAGCSGCHEDAEADHDGSAHAATVASLDALPASLTAAFGAGTRVELGGGAYADLSADRTVTVTDQSGASTAAFPVVAALGSGTRGVALALGSGSHQVVAPFAWAAEGRGPPDGRDAEGLVARWTEGWFDEDGRFDLGSDGLPGPEADWNLQCAGCHVTGHRLEADGEHYVLVPVGAGEVEAAVGCESCHGPGSAHVVDESPLSIFNPQDVPPARALDNCGRCHTRTRPTEHPLADTPAFPVDAAGDFYAPWAELAEGTEADRQTWTAVPVSRRSADEGGDFATSPHRDAEGVFLGSCEDCHEAHGSRFDADLRTAASERELCTSCHLSAFPDTSVDLSHAHHSTYDPEEWGTGACTGCHLPRAAVVVRGDSLSGMGEARSHSLWPWTPGDTVAEFDALGESSLALDEVPSSPCLDCHLQAQSGAYDEGEVLTCPTGDPTERRTHEELQLIMDYVFGVTP